MSSEEEKEHWWQVMRCMQHYLSFCEYDLGRRQQHLNKLHSSFARRLPDVSYSKLGDIHDVSKANQAMFDDMVHYLVDCGFVPVPASIKALSDGSESRDIFPKRDVGPIVHIQQQHRNQAILHSIYREWSREAAAERAESFGKLLSALQRHLPVDPERKYEHRVLVPGCGLGRLPAEVAGAGYSCEGNEFSAYMASASNFFLNEVTDAGKYQIFPWANSVCNIVKVDDVLQGYQVPDIAAVDIIGGEESKFPYPKFSMAAGDFVQVYGTFDNVNSWASVVTCFFLDTAPVLLEYIEVISGILKPGGVWVNLGPLLYHWVADVESNNDERYDQSIELSYEEVKFVVESFGLEFLEESWQECTYTHCTSSMMHTVYKTVLFVVRKPMVPPPSQLCEECSPR